MLKYFFSSFIVAIIGLSWAYYYGSYQALYITALLAVLEVSLSFDNAVVNAKVLETMTPKYQKAFIWFGMPIAVFGMRFLFPILIVAITAGMGFVESFNLALNNPELYHQNLVDNEKLIFAFGGSFLLMVFLDFFFDDEKEIAWIKFIEDNSITRKLTSVSNIELIVAISIGLYLSWKTGNNSIAIAYFSGVLLHSLINSLDDLLSTDNVKSGIIGLLYLEILDASFSFDGVIGAFALSNDIFIIMAGLGIGAMFVRSLTIYFVEKKTLSEFIYLEHGALWAIGILAVIMFVKMFDVHISEAITGTIGFVLIALSFIHSLIVRNK
jgi:hypothetical protein